MDTCTHRHTCTQGHTHTWTHVRTRTHTAALRRVLLHLEDLGASKASSCREGPRAGPDLAPSGSPGPQPGPAPWGADSAGGPSSATPSGLRPHKGAGPWPCGGGAGPVGTDLPGPGGGAGTERPRGAASLGLQQRGQRRRRGAGACFTGQESPGWGFRPPQAGPTPTPHLLGGLGWALPPQSVPVGRGSPPPPAPEGSAGAGEGQQGSQAPALGRGWSGRRRAALPGRSEPTDDPGPLQSRRTAWESEVEGRPRQRLIASSLTASPCTGCQARPARRGLSYQPFVPEPSTICWGSSGGSWCTNRPEGPLDPAVSGPQARMGGGGRLAGSKWGPGPGNTLVSCS